MGNAFTVIKYVEKRMKACKVPKKAISCDNVLRIIEMAQRALKVDEYKSDINPKRTEELCFAKAGDVYFGYLINI